MAEGRGQTDDPGAFGGWFATKFLSGGYKDRNATIRIVHVTLWIVSFGQSHQILQGFAGPLSRNSDPFYLYACEVSLLFQ